MRPSVVLLGFALGSAASITFALLGVTVVYWILGPDYPRLRTEFPTLLSSLALFGVLTAAAAASFYGQLRGKAWRHVAIAASRRAGSWATWGISARAASRRSSVPITPPLGANVGPGPSTAGPAVPTACTPRSAADRPR